jgi:hypothetical protein
MVPEMRLSFIISYIGLFRRPPAPRRGKCWIGLVLALCCGLAGIGFSQSTAPATPAGLLQLDVDPAGEFLSVFDDDPSHGKDPFFPNSDRIKQRPIIPDPIPDPNKKDGQVLWDLFELKGISISSAKRLALINNYTLAEGETRKYKFPPDLYYNVTCISIKERSVIVRINGQTKELSLRAGL